MHPGWFFLPIKGDETVIEYGGFDEDSRDIGISIGKEVGKFHKKHWILNGETPDKIPTPNGSDFSQKA